MLPVAPLLLLTIGGPLAPICAAPSAPVVIRSVGLGVVESLDDSCERALLSTGEDSTVVDGEGLVASVREVMPPDQAQAVLDELRRIDVVAGEGTDGRFSDRSLRLMDGGDPVAQAIFLRELYATGATTAAQQDAILAWEQQLLGEVAFVLAMSEDRLAAEMRLRHRR